MTSLALAALAGATLAHAHEPTTQVNDAPAPIAATAVMTGPLPREIHHKGDTWLLDGHRLTGTEEARGAAMMTILAQAPGNEERVDRARRRERQALTMASGAWASSPPGWWSPSRRARAWSAWRPARCSRSRSDSQARVWASRAA